jgi:hypothetical protein
MWHPDFDVAARYVMSPPIRSAEHGQALKKVHNVGHKSWCFNLYLFFNDALPS